MEWTTTSTLLSSLSDYRARATWEAFVRRFQPALVAYGRRVGLDEEEAEDLAQTALMRFGEAYKAGRFRKEKGSLRNWLFTIASRLAIDVHRDRARRTRHFGPRSASDSVPLEEIADGKDHEEAFEAEWREHVLHACLQRARAEFRDRTWAAFEAFAVQGRPANEVAEELGVSRHAIYLAKHRVTKRLAALREEFEGAG